MSIYKILFGIEITKDLSQDLQKYLFIIADKYVLSMKEIDPIIPKLPNSTEIPHDGINLALGLIQELESLIKWYSSYEVCMGNDRFIEKVNKYMKPYVDVSNKAKEEYATITKTLSENDIIILKNMSLCTRSIVNSKITSQLAHIYCKNVNEHETNFKEFISSLKIDELNDAEYSWYVRSV